MLMTMAVFVAGFALGALVMATLNTVHADDYVSEDQLREAFLRDHNRSFRE